MQRKVLALVVQKNKNLSVLNLMEKLKPVVTVKDIFEC